MSGGCMVAVQRPHQDSCLALPPPSRNHLIKLLGLSADPVRRNFRLGSPGKSCRCSPNHTPELVDDAARGDSDGHGNSDADGGIQGDDAHCDPLDSDARPSGLCASSSGATASTSVSLGSMPLRPRHPQHHPLRLTRTHAPADMVSTAAWRQLRSLRYSDACPCGHYVLSIAPCNPLASDAGPGGFCVSSSGAIALIFASLGCMPLLPRHPQHSSPRVA
jgi:hypothetical protein